MNPYLPLPVFRAPRPRARAAGRDDHRDHRARARRARQRRTNDALQVLHGARATRTAAALTPNEITGILVSMMFAGHHTSSGTAAWTLIELLRNPEWLARVRRRSSTRSTPTTREVSYQALREVPVLESVDQGGAAPPPAARHPDARRARGLPRRRAATVPAGQAGRDLAGGLAPHSRAASATPSASIPTATRPAARRTQHAFALDPVRRRAAIAARARPSRSCS